MKTGIIVFPGSNCDHDAFTAASRLPGQTAVWLWHQTRGLQGVDAVILPGGFSYGDYLRTGALASYSPILDSVREFARAGGPVLGICNGFQILCEAGLLPGALMPNSGGHFICRPVRLRVENNETPFTSACASGQTLTIPIAHGEGNYYCSPAELASLEAHGQIVFRYVDKQGNPSPSANPNGSLANIAGICNAGRNVVGLMPHPERAIEPGLGSSDGLAIFQSLASYEQLVQVLK